MSTKRDNTSTGQPICEKSYWKSDAPRNTKKTRIKKSRKGLILDAIEKCSDELERATPARKPPITIENPNCSAKAATKSAQAIETRKSNSCERASLSNNRGRALRPNQSIATKSAHPFASTSNNAQKEKLDPVCMPERITSNKIATTSCTSIKPTTILPYKLCKSFFSERSLIMIIVLEKVRQSAM